MRLFRWLFFLSPTWLLAQGLSVALMLPLRGNLAPLGQEFLLGFRLGLHGPVTVRVWDTRGDPQRVRQYGQVLQHAPPVRLVVAPLTTREIRALLSLTLAPGVTLYSPLALDPGQCARPNLFGPFAQICAETRRLAAVLQALQVQHLLVLSPRSPRPLARYRALQSLLQGSARFALYPEQDTLALGWLDPLLDTVSTEGLILCGAGPTAVALADYARGIGFHGRVFAFGEWLQPETRSLTRFTDSVFVVTLDPDQARHRSLSVAFGGFRQAFVDSTGVPPGPVALQGYLAGVLVSTMAERHQDPAAFFRAYPTVPLPEGFQLLLPDTGFIKLVLLRHGTVKEVVLR